MPIGTGIIYNVGDLILGTVSGSGTAFLETKIAAATSSIVYFDSNARINSASLNSITVGTASYVSGSTSIITNLTASNISASGTSSFGYVGIGTSSPSTKLHVRLDNAGETTLALFENGLTDFASAAAGQIVVGARGYNHTVLRQNPDLGTTPSIGSSLDTVLANTCALGSGYGKLILATQSTASLIIDYSGNVGIGTASPTRKLDVNGDVNIGTNLVVVSGIYNANYYAGNSTATYFKNSVGTDTLTILQGGNVGIGTTSPLGKLHIVGGGNQGALVIQGSSIISHFYYGTNEDTYIRPGKTVGAVFIADVGGNVGIGTTTTTAKLHVSGSTGGVFEVDTAGGATSLYVSASGNIGIGTTTPNSTLQIAGTSTGILTVGTLTNDWGGVVAIGTTNGNGIILSKVNTANDSNRVLVLMRDDTNGASIIGYVPAGTSASVGFQIRASASSYFNGGNVGIGTTSPQFLLDVVSTSTTPKLRIGNAGSNNGAQLILAGSNTTKNWVIANQQNLNGTLEFTQTTATGSSTVDTTPSMVINSSGNVGIGTTSPAAKLYVVSSGGPIARFDGSSVASSGATEIDVLGPQSNGDLNLGIGGSTFNEASNNIQNKAFITAGTGLTGLNLRSDAGYVQITTGGIASANERMRIAADGNVGIGTTGALTNGKLQISGSIGLSGNTEIRQATNSDGNTLRLLATQVVVGPQNSTSYGYTGGGLLASVSSAASTITLDVGGNVAGHRLQIVNDGTGQSGYLNYSNAGTSSFFVNSVSGNVGIGTTSPSAKLNISLDGVVANTLSLINVGSWGNNTVQLFNSNGGTTGNEVLLLGCQAGGNGQLASGFGFGRESSATWGTYISLKTHSPSTSVIDELYERVRITADGNVGIGTTSPTQLLELKKTTGSVITILNYNDSVKFNINASSTGAGYVGMITNHPLIFVVNDAEKVRIDTAGNVGIGVSAPNTKLTVWTPSTTGLQTALRLNNPFGFDNVNTGTKIVFSQDRTAAEDIPMGEMGVGQEYGATSQAGYMFFSTQLNTSMGEKMRITSDGYVGIGTSSPKQKLHIVGEISLRESDGYYWNAYYSSGFKYIGTGYAGYTIVDSTGAYTINTTNSSGTADAVASMVTRLYISSSGNVGIGTTSPSSLLTISGTGTLGSGFQEKITNGTTTLALGTNATAAEVQSQGSVPLYLNYGGNNVCIVPVGSGNVGIGTTAPGTLLDVSYGDYQAAGTIRMGADLGANTSRTNATRKWGLITGYNYTNASASIPIIGYDSANTYTAINIGGGTSTITASPTYISFYTTSSLSAPGAERVRIISDGNVGIGTTSPVTQLHVSGSLQIGNGTNYGNKFTLYDDFSSGKLAYVMRDLNSDDIFGLYCNSTTGEVRFLADDDDANTAFMTFQTNASERMRITNAGSVGIGVTPTTIVGASGVNGKGLQGDSWTISSLQGTDESYFGNNLYSSAYNVWSNRVNAASGAYYLTGGTHIFLRGAAQPSGSITPTESMRITDTGAVGIGLTNPNTKLQVSGSATIGGYNAVYSGTGVNSLSITAPLYPVLAFYYGTTLAGTVGGYSDHVSIYAPASKYISFEPGDSEKMRITADGNVGIGTTSPTAKLQINNASDSRLIVYETGTSPYTATLELSSQVLGTYGATVQYTSDTEKLTIQNYGRSSASSTQGGILFRTKLNNTTATDVMAINGFSGNVGIGTTVPVAKLEISGSSNSALLNIKSPISGAILFVSGSGAVGINTSTVGAYTLQVNGSFAATTKSFIIDHPTKAGKKLIYGSLESPYHGIRLTGRDTLKEGKCKVELPDYIYKLILHDSVNIQLTGIKCNKTLYVDEINIPENYFTIAYDNAIFESYKDYDFFWDFTGIRTDVPELITEL